MSNTDPIINERERRLLLWAEVCSQGSQDLEPSWLRDRRIYGGAQGIWVDKKRTAEASPDGNGITVSFLHTGRHYADELSDDGVVYRYPATRRPSSRDAGEVQATKNAGMLQVPLFVILPGQSSRGRRIRLGWIADFDDVTRCFLVLFGEQPFTVPDLASDDPFQLFSSGEKKTAMVKVRPGQQRFRFQVLKHYGPKCGVCEITEPRLLKAAHICGKADKGGDDWRNGLPLCSTHHDAYDAHFFAIHPKTMAIHFAPALPGASIGISAKTLELEKATPHPEALRWRWKDTTSTWA